MKAYRGWPLLLALCAATGACSSTKGQSSNNQTPDAAADDTSKDDTTASKTAFAADPEPEGAALYVSVDTSDPARPMATVWAARLGSVFGISLHLSFDAKQVAVSKPRIEPALGPDKAGEARYLITSHAGEVRLGAVRRGPIAGEQKIVEPVALAVVPFEVVAPGTGRLELLRAQARRADGSFIPVKVAGGDFSTGGAQ